MGEVSGSLKRNQKFQKEVMRVRYLGKNEDFISEITVFRSWRIYQVKYL